MSMRARFDAIICIGIKILGGYHPFTPEITAEIISTCNDQRAYIAIHVGTRESGSHLGGLRDKYGEENFVQWWRGFTGGDPPSGLDEADPAAG